ncbi:acetyl-CoA carboxylase biotin carboxyl carrier protein subunit [Rhizobium sp. AC27/96]|uniref:acetyl-CoA carboxylase biotin carboxyl carrier protein n=1 Tax=Rhizobium sp. AC27/96 TaxID=1841653 RepID=UPI000827C34D|nr:acetyl-CoA carboxylase biotin carboxyl carrier protein subunit [Rhizobium sp. AC27/96]OCJ07754.1 acetyl-CoA carboxylase biotin carboxyl carrier protein subunit [Rhizobium sp. AC27/96]
MDLSKIKTLIDFVGRSSVTELTVTEKDVSVRIFRMLASVDLAQALEGVETGSAEHDRDAFVNERASIITVKAPIFGILHRAPAPGQEPFVEVGDAVQEGQTLFVLEAMKVFNKIAAPHAGRVLSLTEIEGEEVEPGDVLAEISR